MNRPRRSYSQQAIAAGYLPTPSSHGRIFYLPESIYRAINLEETPVPSVFQTRLPRPHRIHIVRLAGTTEAFRPHDVKPTSKVKKSGNKRKGSKKSVSVFFGKLAGSKGKKFLRSFILSSKTSDAASTVTATVPAIPATTRSSTEESIVPSVAPSSDPPSLAPSRSLDGPSEPSPELPSCAPSVRPALRSQSNKPRSRRPLSWAPGFSGEAVAPAGTQRNSVAESAPTNTVKENRGRLSFRSSRAMRGSMDIIAPNNHSVGAFGRTQVDSLLVDDYSPRPSLEVLPNTGQRIPDEKPLIVSNGVAVSIALAEPFVFLQGFEQGDLQTNRSTAMLRGSLHLKITKPSKLKAVSLKFKGRAVTKWAEGIPPKKTETEEVNEIMGHTWTFFNAQFPTAEYSTGADHVELARVSSNENKRGSLEITSILRSYGSNKAEDKRLSLNSNSPHTRSFGNGDGMPGNSVSQKGYRTFQPGDYVYNFELPLDCHLPETIDVELGNVKYQLEATIDRAGAFKSNISGVKEVPVIRIPAEGSLEQVEPIAISRTWDDQLHYDIVISGKSFPLGSIIPIAFKLTPLAKVQCHRIKVFVTEAAEYYCKNKRVHRTEPARRIQLFEKRADQPFTTTFKGSNMRVISGGGVPYDQREAAASGENYTADSSNLLGNLEQSERAIGPTEMEFGVKLPTCMDLAEARNKTRLHFDTTYSNIQVHHWIKIVLRLSRPDTNDPSKRRHFEISIDSPFHILSCRATQANTSLPAYSGPSTGNDQRILRKCGCPGAKDVDGSPRTMASALNTFGSSSPNNSNRTSREFAASSASLQPPPQAHVNGERSPVRNASPNRAIPPRPMDLIRAPSYNPPAFDFEEPPPPLQTPPPQYDDIASPTSGLADYFARLSDAYATEGTEATVIEAGSSSSGSSSHPSLLTIEDEGSDGIATPTNRRSMNLEPNAPNMLQSGEAPSSAPPRAF